MANKFVHYLYLASLCSTYFACILMAFWSEIFKYNSAKWNYYLWFALFIPWVTVWLPLNIFPDVDIGSSVIKVPALSRPLDSLLPSYDIVVPYSFAQIVSYVWLAGVCIFLVTIALKHMQFVLLLKSTSTRLSLSTQKAVKEILTNKDMIPLDRIYMSSIITSPMICHVIQSKIYLPENFFSDYTSNEQKYIFQHECMHYHRCDLLANAAMLLLVCVNWFNPILWFSYRYFCAAQELSCDETLSEWYSQGEKAAYGYALLKFSSNQSSLAPVINCSWSRCSQLKERCLRLKSHRPHPLRNLFGLLLLVALMGVAIAAPHFGKPDDTDELRIVNNSNKILTLSLGQQCLDGMGPISPQNVRVISSAKMRGMCGYSNNCEVFIYAARHCLGSPVGSISFDFISGATTISALNGNLQPMLKGNNLFIGDRIKL